MENIKKSNALAAVAGVVVGAGAVIASVIAIKDKSNQKKVKDVLASAKDLVDGYKHDVSTTVEQSKDKVKKVAGEVIKKAEKVTQSAKKEVKNL